MIQVQPTSARLHTSNESHAREWVDGSSPAFAAAFRVFEIGAEQSTHFRGVEFDALSQLSL